MTFNMNIKRVSFDFDETLSRNDVQTYASLLIKRGVEVHIVTSRCHDIHLKHYHWNNDVVYNVADKVGIAHKNIHFTRHKPKTEILIDTDFLFHLDDDEFELECILDSKISVVPVNVKYDKWKEQCEKTLLI